MTSSALLYPQTSGGCRSPEVEKIISPYAYWPEKKPWALTNALLVVVAAAEDDEVPTAASAGVAAAGGNSTQEINHNSLWTCLMSCCMDPVTALYKRATKEWGYNKGRCHPPKAERVTIEFFTDMVQKPMVTPLLDAAELSKAQTIIIANFTLVIAFFGLVPSTDNEYASLCNKIIKRYEALTRGKESNPLIPKHFMSFKCAKEVHKRAESWAGFRPLVSMCLARRFVLAYDTPQIEAWQVIIAQVCEYRGLMPAKLIYEALCAAGQLQIKREDINQQGHTFLNALRQIRDGVRAQVGDQIDTRDFTPYLHFFATDAPALNPKQYKALVVLSTEYVNAMAVEMPQRYEAYKYTKLHTLASNPTYYYKPLSLNIKKQLAAYARMVAAMVEIEQLSKNGAGDLQVYPPTQVECLLEDQFHLKLRRTREQVTQLLDSFLL